MSANVRSCRVPVPQRPEAVTLILTSSSLSSSGRVVEDLVGFPSLEPLYTVKVGMMVTDVLYVGWFFAQLTSIYRQISECGGTSSFLAFNFQGDRLALRNDDLLDNLFCYYSSGRERTCRNASNPDRLCIKSALPGHHRLGPSKPDTILLHSNLTLHDDNNISDTLVSGCGQTPKSREAFPGIDSCATRVPPQNTGR